MTTAAPPRRSPFGDGLRGILLALTAVYGAAGLYVIGHQLRHNGGIPPLLGLVLLVGAGACAWLAARTTAAKRRRLFVLALVFLALGVFQAGLWFIAIHAGVALAAVLAWRASRKRESTGHKIAFVALAVGLTLLWIAMLAIAGLFALYSGDS